jgi:hypothetical protein
MGTMSDEKPPPPPERPPVLPDPVVPDIRESPQPARERPERPEVKGD